MPTGSSLTDLRIAGQRFQLQVFTLADTDKETLGEQASALFALFLEREAEFGFHPSVVVEYPDISDRSGTGFFADAAAYATRRAALMAEDLHAIRIVILTTYSDVVRTGLEAAGYRFIAIDMPAGPEHTGAFMLEPSVADRDMRTLYIEAVNEDDEKIRPSFVLCLLDGNGRLCGGACGSIHERAGRRFAYLATMALASGMPAGAGTALLEQLVQFLRSQQVAMVHLGTQTAAEFYQKCGFTVDHRLIRGLRIRSKNGQEVLGDLVMLSMAL
ncbi:MAG: GNAT family N-acetyltransferase [Flavobacteriales bacterium]